MQAVTFKTFVDWFCILAIALLVVAMVSFSVVAQTQRDAAITLAESWRNVAMQCLGETGDTL